MYLTLPKNDKSLLSAIEARNCLNCFLSYHKRRDSRAPPLYHSDPKLRISSRHCWRKSRYVCSLLIYSSDGFTNLVFTNSEFVSQNLLLGLISLKLIFVSESKHKNIAKKKAKISNKKITTTVR